MGQFPLNINNLVWSDPDPAHSEFEDILDSDEEVGDPLDEQADRKRCKQSDFPGETFRVLKEKETRKYGEYRTRRLVLEAWEKIGDSISSSGLRT